MDLKAVIAFVYCGVALVSALILIFCAVTARKVTPRYSISTFIFLSFLFAGLCAIFDCAYILRENDVTNFPDAVNYLLTLLYVIFSTLTGVFWVCYSEKKQKSVFAATKKRFYLYCLPFALFLIVILTTPFTHWFFYFENGSYKRGPLFIVLSSLLMVYIFQTGVVALVKSFKKENYVDRNEYRRLFSFAVVYSFIQLIQIILPNVFPYRSVGTMLVYGFFLVQNLKESLGHDALVNINNRFAAERQLEAVLNNKNVSEIAMLDVDKFKSINDQYGHQEGDKALQYVGIAMAKSVDKSCFLARMGGDEFIIINNDTNDSIIDVEQRINNNLETLFKEHNCPYRFTVSVGYAVKDETINSIPDFIKVADTKLYERKNEKQQIVVKRQ